MLNQNRNALKSLKRFFFFFFFVRFNTSRFNTKIINDQCPKCHRGVHVWLVAAQVNKYTYYESEIGLASCFEKREEGKKNKKQVTYKIYVINMIYPSALILL